LRLIRSRAIRARETTMHRSSNTSSLSILCALAALSLPTGSALAQETGASSPLVEKVRHATARFVDINVALAEGWVPATPCVSGPDTGAMGVHLVLPSRLDHVVLDASQPQALIYEPTPSGPMRLVGVEFIVTANVWAAHNPPPAVPALEGNLLNFIGEPNRFGLPAFYELHVWAWERNPSGTLADWNTHVTCDHQPVSAPGGAAPR
jgi:hypothetical protein